MKISLNILFVLSTLLITGHLHAKSISQDELQALMKSAQKPVLIDVRTAAEYTDGHIPGAINIPHKTLESRLAELSGMHSNQIILYCRSGRRADIAKEVLAQNGFQQLDHLSGDYIAWNEKGLPVVQGKLKKAK